MSKINEYLYIGSYFDAKKLNLLSSLNITHIVNLSQLDNCFPNNFNYLKIDIDDDNDENISQYFNKVSKFIHNAVLSGGKIFVHCIVGKSRSPCLVAAYLCKKRKMKLIDALSLIKNNRIIDINLGFLQQLENKFD